MERDMMLRATIRLESGNVLSGEVLTANNYPQADRKDNWYVEIRDDDLGYRYWKQNPDGGSVEFESSFRVTCDVQITLNMAMNLVLSGWMTNYPPEDALIRREIYRLLGMLPEQLDGSHLFGWKEVIIDDVYNVTTE
jgi:hypothetical protein